MKKNSPLSELTLNELTSKKKTIQGAAIGLGIVMLIACITLIYLSITTKKAGMITIPIGCALAFLPIVINLKQINSEISKRSSK